MVRKRLTQNQRWNLAVRQEFKCAVCATTLTDACDNDHLIPLRDGGTNLVSNFQLLCLTCHRRKSLHEERCFAARQRGDSNFVCPRCLVTVSTEGGHVCALSRKIQKPKRFMGKQRAIEHYFKAPEPPTLLEKLELLRYRPPTNHFTYISSQALK